MKPKNTYLYFNFKAIDDWPKYVFNGECSNNNNVLTSTMVISLFFDFLCIIYTIFLLKNIF